MLLSGLSDGALGFPPKLCPSGDNTELLCVHTAPQTARERGCVSDTRPESPPAGSPGMGTHPAGHRAAPRRQGPGTQKNRER